MESVLWIQDMEHSLGSIPTLKDISQEFGITINTSKLYLLSYHNMDVQKRQDLNELFEGFNVLNHSPLWWKIIVGELKRIKYICICF